MSRRSHLFPGSHHRVLSLTGPIVEVRCRASFRRAPHLSGDSGDALFSLQGCSVEGVRSSAVNADRREPTKA